MGWGGVEAGAGCGQTGRVGGSRGRCGVGAAPVAKGANRHLLVPMRGRPGSQGLRIKAVLGLDLSHQHEL